MLCEDLEGGEGGSRGMVYISTCQYRTGGLGRSSLGWEDLLDKEMVTHSGFLAWRIPRTEEPGGL